MDILVIEDDAMLQQVLYRGLMSEGHTATIAGTGREGQARLDNGTFDALVLDLTLPDIDGIDLARGLREAGNTVPILMLTARDQLDDRLRGFGAGADDYLVKPFALRELLARLTAIVRRVAPERSKTRLVVGDVTLDRRACEVCRAGVVVHLAPKEYAVLELLMAEAGAVLSRDALLRRVWDYSFEGDSNVVETSIKRLRRVIDSGRATPLIHTVRGVGYKISAPR